MDIASDVFEGEERLSVPPFLVLATDGIWDETSANTVVEEVRFLLKKKKGAEEHGNLLARVKTVYIFTWYIHACYHAIECCVGDVFFSRVAVVAVGVQVITFLRFRPRVR